MQCHSNTAPQDVGTSDPVPAQDSFRNSEFKADQELGEAFTAEPEFASASVYSLITYGDGNVSDIAAAGDINTAKQATVASHIPQSHIGYLGASKQGEFLQIRACNREGNQVFVIYIAPIQVDFGDGRQ